MGRLVIRKYVSVDDKAVKVNGDAVLLNDASKDFNDFIRLIYHHYNMQYSKFFKMDDQSKLGFTVAEILLAGDSTDGIDGKDKAVIIANSSSSLLTDEKYNETVKEIPSPNVFVYTLPNIVSGEICIRHSIKGENTFFVQEKFDIPFMVNYINILFSTTGVKKVIAGWNEFSLNGNYRTFLMDVMIAGESAEEIGDFTIETINQIYTY